MPATAFALPIRGDYEEHSRELVAALTGARGDAMHERRLQHGFRRVRVWRQLQPQPTVIVYLEADDLDGAIEAMSQDTDETAQWVLERISNITGRHPGEHGARPPSDLMIDWHPEHGHSSTDHD